MNSGTFWFQFPFSVLQLRDFQRLFFTGCLHHIDCYLGLLVRLHKQPELKCSGHFHHHQLRLQHCLLFWNFDSFPSLVHYQSLNWHFSLSGKLLHLHIHNYNINNYLYYNNSSIHPRHHFARSSCCRCCSCRRNLFCSANAACHTKRDSSRKPSAWNPRGRDSTQHQHTDRSSSLGPCSTRHAPRGYFSTLRHTPNEASGERDICRRPEPDCDEQSSNEVQEIHPSDLFQVRVEEKSTKVVVHGKCHGKSSIRQQVMVFNCIC